MVTGDSTSSSLLAKVRNLNDEEAWRRFFSQYQPLILAWCRRKGLPKSDAEETASAVFQALVRSLPSFEYDSSQSFRAWLHKVVMNKIIDLQREGARPGARGAGGTALYKRLASLAEIDDLADGLSRRLEEELQLVQLACERIEGRVEPHVWRAFWLTTIEDRPGKEVAALLGIKVATVFVYKGRVGKMLREELRLLGHAETSEV